MNDIIFKTLLLKGEAGNNIQSIEKTATSGLVDTYTVTLTDGSTTTFDVTNGAYPISVEKTATSGIVDTYTITMANGDTFNFTVTNANNDSVYYFDTVVELKRTNNLASGMYVRTGGYYEVNDGGGALYKITDVEPSFYYESLERALYAELIIDNNINVKQFGAKGDGVTDDTEALKRAFECNTIKMIIPSGIYIINIEATTRGSASKFFNPAYINEFIGIENKSIIKLGSGNCNAEAGTGLQSIFHFSRNADRDIKFNNIIFDFNYNNNVIYHEDGQYTNYNANFAQLAISANKIRDLTIRNCAFIGHSGTNCINYYANADNTRPAIIDIEYCTFDKIGGKSLYNDNGTMTDAYHDCSTIAIHADNSINRETLNRDTAIISNNIFNGVGGNAFNTCEVGAKHLFYCNNSIFNYYIGVMPLAVIRETTAYINNNSFHNVAHGVNIWFNKDDYNYGNDVIGFELIDISNNNFNISPAYWESVPVYSSHTISDGVYSGRKYKCIGTGGVVEVSAKTIKIERNFVNFDYENDITTEASFVYMPTSINSVSDMSIFSITPFINTFLINGNVVKKLNGTFTLISAHPSLTDVKIADNIADYLNDNKDRASIIIRAQGFDNYPLIVPYNKNIEIVNNNFKLSSIATSFVETSLLNNVANSYFKYIGNNLNGYSGAEYIFKANTPKLILESDIVSGNKLYSASVIQGVTCTANSDVTIEFDISDGDFTNTPTVYAIAESVSAFTPLRFNVNSSTSTSAKYVFHSSSAFDNAQIKFGIIAIGK